jgi:CDP-glucose 4,6-dehydratase
VEDLGLNLGFWNGKQVLMTGHTGFKGAWLSLWLQRLGAYLVGYSLGPPTEPNLFGIAGIESGMISIFGDVRDLSYLTAVLAEHRPEIVIHMAAQSLVRRSYVEPVETYSTNVMGTVNVLEATRECRSVKAILVVTSDKCYENREWFRPYRENEPLGGSDPYSSSKACAELVTAAYRRSFFNSVNGSEPAPRVATVRSGNVIGGGDWAQHRLVPDCIRAFIASRPVELRYPESVRPWQHVLDPLFGYMTLCERLFGDDAQEFSDAWNFGPEPGDDTTVGDVAQRVAHLWGAGAPQHSPKADAPHEAGILRLDISKAADRLGFRRRWDLERAIEETVAWYKAWNSGEDMRAFSLEQIATYEADA